MKCFTDASFGSHGLHRTSGALMRIGASTDKNVSMDFLFAAPILNLRE
jgi:hypothetical protein